MKCSVQIVFYCGMGGHPAISHAGQFLVGKPDTSFGPAIDEIVVYAHVPSSTHTQSLESMRQRFEEHLTKLPLAWFNKKESLAEVSYRSELGYEEQLIGPDRDPSTFTLFENACKEVVGALEFASNRLKNIDGFDWDRLLLHATDMLRQVPSTNDDLKSVLRSLRAQEKDTLLP